MCHFEGFPRNLSLLGVSYMKLHHDSLHKPKDQKGWCAISMTLNFIEQRIVHQTAQRDLGRFRVRFAGIRVGFGEIL